MRTCFEISREVLRVDSNSYVPQTLEGPTPHSVHFGLSVEKERSQQGTYCLSVRQELNLCCHSCGCNGCERHLLDELLRALQQRCQSGEEGVEEGTQCLRPQVLAVHFNHIAGSGLHCVFRVLKGTEHYGQHCLVEVQNLRLAVLAHLTQRKAGAFSDEVLGVLDGC